MLDGGITGLIRAISSKHSAHRRDEVSTTGHIVLPPSGRTLSRHRDDGIFRNDQMKTERS
jgi:hypothetical protein